ncbi:MAG: STAS domain-containing protein [Verrucomicrobiota bacterium]
MIHVESDESIRLLKLSYSGNINPQELAACHEEVMTHLQRVEGGFLLLVDMTGVKSIDSSCAPFIERMMDLFNQTGIEAVIRVIPDPHKDIGFNIMSLFHYDRGVRMNTCSSLDEALELL